MSRKIDTPLKQMAYVQAFKEMAKMADGRIDPDSQIEWCIAVGFLAPHPITRGELCLTERGMSFAWLWWKAVSEGQKRALTEKIILPPGVGA